MKKETSAGKAFSLFKKYFSEFVLIFISVILAFLMTEWSNNKNDQISEVKILTEIDNGINSDLEDFQSNVKGHQFSIRAISLVRQWLNNEPIQQDSIGLYYDLLFRNFTPIINKSGYESLKSTGLKTVTNDSLRFQIIKLYDYYYTILEKLEDHVAEMQDFGNFHEPTNKLLSSYMVFDSTGKLVQLSSPNQLTATQKREILSYLWKIENNKKFKILRYNSVIEAIKKLDGNIRKELEGD